MDLSLCFTLSLFSLCIFSLKASFKIFFTLKLRMTLLPKKRNIFVFSRWLETAKEWHGKSLMWNLIIHEKLGGSWCSPMAPPFH